MEAHDCHYGTPLHVACAREHFDCAKVLLNAGEAMFVWLRRTECHDFLADGWSESLK